MAHYAEIDQNNVVLRVLVVKDAYEGDEGTDAEKEVLGALWCHNFAGGTWKKTSYNGNYRGIFAGPGCIYDPVEDVFKAPPEQE